MMRVIDFLERHFKSLTTKATMMTYTSGILQSITRKLDTPRVYTKKEIKNVAERDN